MTSYFDSLADVVPADTIAAMHRAVENVSLRGGGVPGEPAIFAGIRVLIDRVRQETQAAADREPAGDR